MAGPHDQDSKPPALHKAPHAEHSIAAIAEESIAIDVQHQDIGSSLSRTVSRETTGATQHSLAGSFRQSSYLASGPRSFLGAQQSDTIVSVTEQDRENATREERSLLRDNNIIPPKKRRRSVSQTSSVARKGLRPQISFSAFTARREESLTEDVVERGQAGPVDETTALLDGPGSNNSSDPLDGEDISPEDIDRKWEEAVMKGQIQTSWQREAKVLARYSFPLILTFFLQCSLTLTSVFVVGHMGKNELGAVSLGVMTFNITGSAVFNGLATSLDTLCAQAYGSGRKELVGLYMQRMVWFLWLICIPLAILWLFASSILALIVPEQEIALLAGQYLRIMIFAAPGYAAFESGKRYVQAQGRFSANLYVLLIAAPLNVFLQWFFVYHLNIGFIGCAIATAIVQTLMPTLLFLYVRFIGGMDCWPGFTTRAFQNWGPMIRLALPGLAMVMAEFMAFEILTLASARISATHLAAQTILQSLSVMAYSLPFPLSIAASTRVANFIGAALPDAAKVTMRVAFVGGSVLGLFNMVMLSSLRDYIPALYTDEADVRALAAQTLPLNAAFQLLDSLAAQGNGVLRGLGKQEIGGYINLFAYYGIAVPFSFFAAFWLRWDLYGLWAGPAIALGVVAALEALYIYRTSWEDAAEEASQRNAAG